MHLSLDLLKYPLDKSISLSFSISKWNLDISLTSNEFILKSSFEFDKVVCEQDVGLFLASLYISSLFTNVPLEESNNICVNELFKSNSGIHGHNKIEISEMLSLTTKESIILFEMVFYTLSWQCSNRVPIGTFIR